MSSAKVARTKLSLAISAAILCISIAGLYVALFQRQWAVDHLSVWQYQPTSEAAELRDELRLTELGRWYYDASRTVIEPAEQFNRSCSQHVETNNPILGCYSAQRIYVYQITNDKLEGIEETTAAHEVLHAAYERMDEAERSALDSELLAAYERVKTPELEERMDYYEQTEPGQEANELHSILGTEVRDLGDTLETHYKQFFESRSHILSYFESYSSVFQTATTKMKQLETSINQATAEVNLRIETYNQNTARLGSDLDAFQSKNASGGFNSREEFDTERAALVARQASLEAERRSIQQVIETIETERQEYNQLVDEYNQLSRSINSSLAPTPTLGSE